MTITLTDPARRTGNIVRRHPLASFFVLAYGLSWLAWLPYVLATNTGLGLLPVRIPTVLGSTQTLGLTPGGYLGPITAALIVTAIAEGRPGLRRWARRLVHWRVGWRWFVFVVFVVPAVLIISTFALPGAWHDPQPPTAAALLAYLPMLFAQVLTTGLAEEPGWRDFALPRVQRRLGPLRGTVLLGLVWGGWHLPLFLTAWAGWPDVNWYDPVEFLATAVVLSISITWVFNHTGESLPLVMLLHASVNTVFSVLWPQMFPGLDAFHDSLHALLIATTISAVVLVVVTRGRLGAHTGESGR